MKWFTPSDILSYGMLYNYICGVRGGGKTVNTLAMVVNRFIKTKGKSKFNYMRRYQDELKKCKRFIFDDLEALELFPNTTFGVDGDDLYINDCHAGRAVALSKAHQMKSIPWPNYNYTIFDEFLLEQSRSTYLPNEAQLMLGFQETVGRMRNHRWLIIGNATTIANPHFEYWNVQPKRSAKMTILSERKVAIQMYNNEVYMAEKRQTDAYKAIEGTAYARYMFNNEFLSDNYSFVEALNNNANYHFTIHYEGKSYGVWWVPGQCCYHINPRVQPNCKTQFAFTADDHQPNFVLFKNAKNNGFMKQLITAFDRGMVRFSDLGTKMAVYELFDYI